MKRLVPLWLVAWSAGCSPGDGFSEDLDTAAPDAAGLVRLDVFPPEVNDLEDTRGEPLDLRPATLLVDVEANTTFDVTLTPAVSVAGVITGLALTPFASADLPTVPGPLAGAALRFGLEGGVQQPRATTDDDGAFRVLVVPGLLPYDLAIVPATPDVPMTTRKVEIASDTRVQDVFVDAGIPIWGRAVDDAGSPITGASIRVQDDRGLLSAPATTDAQGRYLIAVEPEHTYTVVFEGRANQDPRILFPAGLVSGVGLQVDLPVGSLEVGAVTGRIVGQNARPVDDDAVRVRLVATSLTGLDDLAATFEVEVGTDAGVFAAVVPEGTYRIEVAPQDPDGPAPRALAEVEVGGPVTRVGDVALEPPAARLGTVRDTEGLPVGGANVRCAEEGFAGRSWTSTTDPLGQFALTLPSTPMTCAVSPPSSRTDLAMTRQILEDPEFLAPTATWDLELREGFLMVGEVRVRQSNDVADAEEGPTFPLAGAVLEVRDDADNLLGIAISGPNGSFAVRVDR